MSSVHLDERELMSYLDGELQAARAAEVRHHLDACDECRHYVNEAQAALRAFNSAHRDGLPAPPRPWADLREQFQDKDAGRSPILRFETRPRPSGARRKPMWWAAFAAGIALAALMFRLSTGQTVSAAELLHKASAQDRPVARVQVKTSKGRFVRAAREQGDAQLAAMFREANFDWVEPLRAQAFADWRNGLDDKRDDVRIVGRFYKITTSTPEGTLSEVTITIRAADMRAVEERFEFRNSEWVEISEAVDVESVRPEPSIAAHPDAPSEGASVSRADELRVIEALHRIRADLGEPIEVRRTERAVEVTVLGVSDQREREIRSALDGIANVALRFEQPQAVRTPPGEVARGGVEAPEGPLHSRLLRLMGSAANVETFTNATLEASESVMARAHALRQLAERFPDREGAAAEKLREIEAGHIEALRASVDRLTALLQPLTGAVEAGQPRAVDARALLGSAQRLDTILTIALASSKAGDDPEQVVGRIRQALAELERSAAEYKP
jgi:hypothetical protein